MSTGKCKPFRKARLVNGKAIAPATAPARVKRVIDWANRIRNKPYVYGGGHASFNSPRLRLLRLGQLRAARRPLRQQSDGFSRLHKLEEAAVAASGSPSTRIPGHAYMVVAGLRFDTSMTPGDGPGWSKSMRSTYGSFSARHPAGF